MSKLPVIMIRKLAIAMCILFFIPALFFIEGILVGMFYPGVPYSIFYKYYWYMFPALFPGGIIVATYYLIIFWKE